MATENEGWDTSTAFIRRTLHACIEAGRRARGQPGADLYEAYRLLGTGLHTLEDLLAHSNWCEVALRKLGHEEVFCHVGDNGRLFLFPNFPYLTEIPVVINTPNGPAPPLVTGTFGGMSFTVFKFHVIMCGRIQVRISSTPLWGKLQSKWIFL